MNCSMPGLPVHHQLLEFTQTHVHRVNDAIQPSHPLSSPSPPAPDPSQPQGLFQWVNSLQPHGLQHARPPYPLPTTEDYQNSCPLSRWCHPTISSCVIPILLLPSIFPNIQIRSDQPLSHVRLFATPWIAARQASLSITNSWSSLRLTSI